MDRYNYLAFRFLFIKFSPKMLYLSEDYVNIYSNLKTRSFN